MNTSPLIEAIVAKATLMLQNNQNEAGGIIDYERFQDEMVICLSDVQELENERDECIDDLTSSIDELKLMSALHRDAQEQIKSLQSLCRDLRMKDEKSWHFCDEQLN